MSKLLLDSSLIIDLLRRKNKEQSLLNQLVQQGYQLAISIIVHAELYSGKSIWEHKDSKKELEIVLQDMEILFLDEAISKKSGEIRAEYGTSLLDAIIAATAIVHKIDLVTLKVKDFEKIDGINLYEV